MGERQKHRHGEGERERGKETEKETADLESFLSLRWGQSFLLDQLPETRVVQVVDVACTADSGYSQPCWPPLP